MFEIHPDYRNDALVEALPELRTSYVAMLEDWQGDIPGGHVVYRDLLNPLLIRLLQNVDANADQLTRIFAAFEKLASEGDGYLKNIIRATVCERLAAERLFERAVEVMGPVFRDVASTPC